MSSLHRTSQISENNNITVTITTVTLYIFTYIHGEDSKQGEEQVKASIDKKHLTVTLVDSMFLEKTHIDYCTVKDNTQTTKRQLKTVMEESSTVHSQMTWQIQ